MGGVFKEEIDGAACSCTCVVVSPWMREGGPGLEVEVFVTMSWLECPDRSVAVGEEGLGTCAKVPICRGASIESLEDDEDGPNGKAQEGYW